MVANSQTFSWINCFVFWSNFHCSMSLRVQLPALVHVIAWCLKVTSHYLKQGWHSLLMDICVNRPKRIRKMGIFGHYSDVIMDVMASQITSLSTVYSAVYSDADQRKHQSSASLAFVQGIHRWPVNSPHKWPVTREMFPFDDVIMVYSRLRADDCLTHWDQIVHICVNKQDHHWSR